MLKNLKITAVAAAVAGSVFAVAPAQATAITTWNYAINSGFSAFATASPDASPYNGVIGTNTNGALGLPTLLYWGLANDGSGTSSSLDLGGTNGAMSGGLVTNDAPINTVTITHNNVDISGNATLTNASILDTLVLTPTSPAGAPIPVSPLLFNIQFTETQNVEPCPAGVGDGPSNNKPCNDIFVLSTVSGAGAFLNTSDPANVFLSQGLNVGGDNYLINLFINGLGTLPAGACSLVNAPIGCIGFETIEGQPNAFQVRLQILQAPEPISVALFGAGLIGAGALRLRRKAKKA